MFRTWTRTDVGKRLFFKSALGAGGVALVADAAGGARPALAQLMDSGVDANSVLSKVRKEGVLKIGYGQTSPWFYKDARTGELQGIYYEVAQELCKQLEVKGQYSEVQWNDATVALRRGDFDLFASSMTYTVPRATAVLFPVPTLWARGSLALIHKDNIGKWKTAADLDNPDVTFSINAGTSAEALARQMFPKAKMISTTGNILTAAEPVRTKRADAWLNGENDVVVFAKKNASWAAVLDEAHPFGVAPNTWTIRYGDPAWAAFIGFWAQHMVVSNFVKERYDHYMDLTLKG